MDLQEELSRNARDPQDILLETTKKAELFAYDNAKRFVREATQQIKMQLVQNVRQGNFSKAYNKGTVICYYQIPKNRYLKVNITTDFNRKHIRLRTWNQFQVNAEYSKEYEYFRNLMAQWGKENNVTVSFVVKAKGFVLEEPFPNIEPVKFAGNAWPVFQLTIKVVSHFAIDPNLPMDYLTADEAKEKTQKEYERVKRIRDWSNKKKQEMILSGVLTAVFVFALFCCLSICASLPNINIWTPTIICIVMIIFLGALTHSYHDDYVQAKETAENKLKQIQEKEE